MSKYTPAQNKASQRYQRAAYDCINLRLRKDAEPTRETVAAAAEAAGESVQGYILQAIRQRLQAENTGDSGPG